MDYILPLGVSLGFCKKDFYDKLKLITEAGIEYVDFDISGKWNRPKEEKVYYKELERGMEAVKKSGLKVNGVHISFGNRWDPSALRTFNRKRIVKNIVEAIKRVDACDPFCYILHGSFEPILPAKRAKKIDNLLLSLSEICSATKNYVCLEILPRTCLLNTAKEANDILDRAGIENLRICLDTNHFLHEKTEDAILELGSRIATLHVSDHDYINERHWLPGEGKINWNAVLGSLKKAGYHGVFNYEVDNKTPAEIKRNYEWLWQNYSRSVTENG